MSKNSKNVADLALEGIALCENALKNPNILGTQHEFTARMLTTLFVLVELMANQDRDDKELEAK